MTELAIIIVSHNTKADLKECLHSLNSYPFTGSFSIIVVDNKSNDGSAEVIRSLWPKVHLIESSQNLGFSRANNLAIRASSSNFILLLNSDTKVTAGALDSMVKTLRARNDIGILGPRLVNLHGIPEISFGKMINPFNELRQKLLGLGYGKGNKLSSWYIERQTKYEHNPDWVSGACLLVRRTDAEAVGLLDERFFMYGEDVDFCAAVRHLGRRVLFTPDAEIVHLRGRSGAIDQKKTSTMYRRSQLKFYAKHHPQWLGLLRLYLRLRGKLPTDEES